MTLDRVPLPLIAVPLAPIVLPLVPRLVAGLLALLIMALVVSLIRAYRARCPVCRGRGWTDDAAQETGRAWCRICRGYGTRSRSWPADR